MSSLATLQCCQGGFVSTPPCPGRTGVDVLCLAILPTCCAKQQGGSPDDTPPGQTGQDGMPSKVMPSGTARPSSPRDLFIATTQGQNGQGWLYDSSPSYVTAGDCSHNSESWAAPSSGSSDQGAVLINTFISSTPSRGCEALGGHACDTPPPCTPVHLCALC